MLAVGGGRFGSPVQYQTGVNFPAGQVAVADLNGDHHLDLVVVNSCTGAGCSSICSRSGEIASTRTPGEIHSLQAVTPCDLNQLLHCVYLLQPYTPAPV